MNKQNNTIISGVIDCPNCGIKSLEVNVCAKGQGEGYCKSCGHVEKFESETTI